jgi:hypothetical protein
MVSIPVWSSALLLFQRRSEGSRLPQDSTPGGYRIACAGSAKQGFG